MATNKIKQATSKVKEVQEMTKDTQELIQTTKEVLTDVRELIENVKQFVNETGFPELKDLKIPKINMPEKFKLKKQQIQNKEE